MFLMDLLSGVIFFQYGRELDIDAHLSAISCTQQQINWIMIQKLLRNVKPSFTFLKEPSSRARKAVFRFVTNPLFSKFTYGIIMVDTIRLGLVYSDMPDSWEDILDKVNYVCTGIFIFEAISRYVAHKKRTFHNKWVYVEIIVLVCSKQLLLRSC